MQAVKQDSVRQDGWFMRLKSVQTQLGVSQASAEGVPPQRLSLKSCHADYHRQIEIGSNQTCNAIYNVHAYNIHLSVHLSFTYYTHVRMYIQTRVSRLKEEK